LRFYRAVRCATVTMTDTMVLWKRNFGVILVGCFVLLAVYTFAFPTGGAQAVDEQNRDVRRDDKLANTNTQLLQTQDAVLNARKRITAIKEELAVLKNITKSSIKTYPKVKQRNEFHRKRILITGGAGFVGSHLVDALMMDGHEVTVIDNFFTGRKKNVEHWLGHPNFELVTHDVVEPFMIEVDEIYHLASPASPPHYMFNPIKTIKTNTLGTINMLGLAKRVGARLLLASTSEVYGNPDVHPQVMVNTAIVKTRKIVAVYG